MSNKRFTFPYLTVRDDGMLGLSSAGEVIIRYNSESMLLEYSADGAAYVEFGTGDGGGDGGAPTTGTYLTLTSNTPLTNERVLTDGYGIDFVDSGANGTLTVNLTTTGVTAGAYTQANITVDAFGRISAAANGGVGTAFIQNGNSFGAGAVLGTNDAFALNFETSGVTRLTIDATGNLVYNEAAADLDFRVESVGTPNALFVQGSDGFVGVNLSGPLERLHVIGRMIVENTLGSFGRVFLDTASSQYGFGGSGSPGHTMDIQSSANPTTLNLQNLDVTEHTRVRMVAGSTQAQISLVTPTVTSGTFPNEIFGWDMGSVSANQRSIGYFIRGGGGGTDFPTGQSFATGNPGSGNPPTERLWIGEDNNATFGGLVINRPGADFDFRVEGVVNSSLLFLDASDESVSVIRGVGTNPGHALTVTAGLLATTKNAISTTATLSTTNAAQVGNNFTVTSAGSGASANQTGMVVSLAAGYSGAATVWAGAFDTNVLATGTSSWLGATNQGNIAFQGTALGAAPGHNTGLYGVAFNSSTQNAGVRGMAQQASAGNNFGVTGEAHNSGAGLKIGGFFRLIPSSAFTTPTFSVSAALMADNSDLASNIFVARDNGTEVVRIGDGAGDHTLVVTAGALASTKSAVNVTGTLANPGTTSQYGGLFTFTTQGALDSLQTGVEVVLSAGFTGDRNTQAISAVNSAAGIKNDPANILSNYGFYGLCLGAGAGSNIGGYGLGRNSTGINVGLMGHAETTTTAPNVGVLGLGSNATGARIGGLFGLFPTGSNPTYTASAALIADNGSTTDPIFVGRDAGTPVFTIANGGAVTATSVGHGFGAATTQPVFNTMFSGSTNNASTVAFNNTGASTDNRLWYIQPTATPGLDFGLGNNDGSTGNNWARVLRSGNNITSISFRAGTDPGSNTPEVIQFAGETAHRVLLTGGVLATTKSAISATATHTASAATEIGYNFVTTLTTGNGFKMGMQAELNGTANTTSQTAALLAYNNSTGSTATGTWLQNSVGNQGLLGTTQGAGSGHNTGGYYSVFGSTTQNTGSFGTAVINTAGANLGSVGIAANATGIMVGVVGRLSANSGTLAAPTLVSAGGWFSNGDSTSAILIANDLNTPVFTIADGGDIAVTPVVGHAGHAVTITAGTLASTKNALNVTSTLNSTAVTQQGSFVRAISSAGATNVVGLYNDILSGFVGTGTSASLQFLNLVEGTGTGALGGASLTGLLSGNGNFGVYGSTQGSTIGHNFGSYAWAASSSTLNVGSFGGAANFGSGVGIGVFGTIDADNAGAGAGGFFTLLDGGTAYAVPTISIDTALIATNSTIAGNIVDFRDDTTTVFLIANGGDATVSPVAGHPNSALTVTGGTLANTKRALEISGTLSGSANTQVAVHATIATTAGASDAIGLSSNLTPGFVGTGSSAAGQFYNDVAGTGTGALAGSTFFGLRLGNGNFGSQAVASRATIGHNFGSWSAASSSSTLNVGSLGWAGNQATGRSIGVVGIADTADDGYAFGGFFTLLNADTYSIPSATIDIALVADNSTIAAPIFQARDNGTAVFTIFDGGDTTLTPTVFTSGLHSALVVTAAAHTGQTSATELIDVNINLARTVQHATGGITTQRSMVVQAPTHSFSAPASIITNAATFAITGAPAAGTNATLTNSYALWVQSGHSRMDGYLGLNATALSTLDVVGSVGHSVTSVSTDITLGVTHHTVLVTAGFGNRVITLPPVAGVARRRYEIMKTDVTANTVTVDGNGGETINGAATFVLTTQYQSISLVNDTGAWYII